MCAGALPPCLSNLRAAFRVDEPLVFGQSLVDALILRPALARVAQALTPLFPIPVPIGAGLHGTDVPTVHHRAVEREL
jgi:hypothetical protein